MIAKVFRFIYLVALFVLTGCSSNTCEYEGKEINTRNNFSECYFADCSRINNVTNKGVYDTDLLVHLSERHMDYDRIHFHGYFGDGGYMNADGLVTCGVYSFTSSMLLYESEGKVKVVLDDFVVSTCSDVYSYSLNGRRNVSNVDFSYSLNGIDKSITFVISYLYNGCNYRVGYQGDYT